MTISLTLRSNAALDSSFIELSVHEGVGGVYSTWWLSFLSPVAGLGLIPHICAITWIPVK